MDNDYLNILKNTELRPKRVKIKERKEEVLLEDDRAMGDMHGTIINFFKENPANSDAIGQLADEMGIDCHEIKKHIMMMFSQAVSQGKITENLNELFVKTGELQGMDKGPERDLTILRLGMIAELDAVNFYDELANLASDERVQKLMLDVSHEEKVHAGEFETLMEELDPSYEEAEEEGEKEVEDLLGS